MGQQEPHQHLQLRRGKLVLIIGPSGVGKSIVLKRLREKHPAFHVPRSATTRARRSGEGDDLYRFVTEEEFDALLREGAFLELAVVHGGARYGTLLEEIIPHIEQGSVVVREVDVQGFGSIRNHQLFRGDDAPYRLQSIFILPESKAQLVQRITHRAPMKDEELNRRLASMEKEMTYAELCDAQIVNGDGKLEEAVVAVEEVILH